MGAAWLCAILSHLGLCTPASARTQQDRMKLVTFSKAVFDPFKQHAWLLTLHCTTMPR